MIKQWRAEGEHGEKKINFWEGPTRISEWKEEQVRHDRGMRIYHCYSSFEFFGLFS